VLISSDSVSNYTAKVADFGYSTLAASEDDLIAMPISRPWNAPECDGRRVKLSEAKKMDAYSFGMLCLWILFKEKFFETALKYLETPEGRSDSVSFMEPRGEYFRQSIVEKLKQLDKLQVLARELVDTTTGFSSQQRCNLVRFFDSTLTRDSNSRISDFRYLIKLLGQDM
jgi:hypothetical protein